MTNESSTPPAKCLQCESQLVSPVFCTGCRALYPPPPSADYFDLLGLPRQYEIDEARLMSAYRAITRNIHPDCFAGEADEVRNLATRISAEVNRAVDVLRDPVQRAAYLLELARGPSAAEVRDVSPELLAEVMTLREQIEEARSRGDTSALEGLRKDIEGRRASIVARLPDLAGRLERSGEDEKKAFRRVLNSIRYFDNLLAEVKGDPLARPAEQGHG